MPTLGPAVRERNVHFRDGGEIAGGASDSGAWLELADPQGRETSVELTEGELLMALEALAMVYADLTGVNPASTARRVSRTLRDRTEAAREGRWRHRRAAA
jgi:hypothetical protein